MVCALPRNLSRSTRAGSWVDPAAWTCAARRRVRSGSVVSSRRSAAGRSTRRLSNRADAARDRRGWRSSTAVSGPSRRQHRGMSRTSEADLDLLTAAIWGRTVDLDEVNEMSKDSAIGHLGIELTELGDDHLTGRMPVDRRTVQPFGILHGGASVLLAETLVSAAAT